MRKTKATVFCFGECQKLLRPAARRVRRDAICGCWVRIGYPQIPQIVLRRCACDELRVSRGWSRPPWGPPAAGVVLARFGGVALNECARRHFSNCQPLRVVRPPTPLVHLQYSHAPGLDSVRACLLVSRASQQSCKDHEEVSRQVVPWRGSAPGGIRTRHAGFGSTLPC